MIYRTTTYYMIKDMKKKIRDVQGGQGSGKNWSIAQLLKEDAEEKPRTITVVTDTYDNLRDGSIHDFKKLWDACGLDWSEAWNDTKKELKHHNSVIQFRYITDKKSDGGKSKRREILYMNEANKVGWTVASTFIGRTHEKVYLDYNPDFEFWAHTELPLLKDDDGNGIVEKIITTYKHNEKIPDSERQFIESRRGNKEWFRVYGEGQTGFYSERRIYPKYEFIESIPDTAIRINSGMDFGKSPDPTILVDMYIDGVDLYIDERFCMNNLEVETIPGSERLSVAGQMEAIDFPKGQIIVGDTDGKTAIIDMRKHGYNIIAVKKPPGSQSVGIGKVKCYNLKLTKRSINVKNGIENWFYKVDHNGKIIPEPDGHEPDGLAAIRYGVMTYML